MLHIAWPFYTKELRQLIKQLKAEGKLREEPLWELDKIVLFLAILPLIIFATIVLTNTIGYVFNFFLFLLFWLVFMKLAVRYIIRHRIIPLSSNDYANAVVVSNPDLIEEGLYNYSTKTWRFNYQLIDDNFSEEIKNKTFQAKNILLDSTVVSNLKIGSNIIILFDKNNPELNFPYIKEIVDKFRLTTDIVIE